MGPDLKCDDSGVRKYYCSIPGLQLTVLLWDNLQGRAAWCVWGCFTDPEGKESVNIYMTHHIRGGSEYRIMNDYESDYEGDYATIMPPASFGEAASPRASKKHFDGRLRLKQRAHNRFHNRSHNRGIIAYSDPPYCGC